MDMNEPTTEQLGWLKIMIQDGTLKPLTEDLSHNNIGTYYLYMHNQSNYYIYGGYLKDVSNNTVTTYETVEYEKYVGGDTGEVREFTREEPVTRTTVLYTFSTNNVTNDSKTINKNNILVFSIPQVLPTHDPRLPDNLITTPTKEQFVMLKLMIYSELLSNVASVTNVDIGKYYLFFTLDDRDNLKGGYLFKINGSKYFFYDNNTDKVKIAESLDYIYSLPDQLPTKSTIFRHFKRIIDVNDKTGVFTLHDNTKFQFPEFKSYNILEITINQYYILTFNKNTNNIEFVRLNLFLDYVKQQQYTGKVVSSLFVQKLCGDINSDGNEKEELYIQFKVAKPGEMIKTDIELFEEEKTKILEISNATQELTIGEELCKTRAKPIDGVYVDTFNRIEDLPNENEYMKIPKDINPTDTLPLYIKYGYYLIQVRLHWWFDQSSYIMVEPIIPIVSIGAEGTNELKIKDRTLTKDEIYTINIKDTAEESLLRNLKIKKDEKVSLNDLIYFYKEDDISREHPIPGKIIEVKYDKEKEKKVYKVEYINEEENVETKDVSVVYHVETQTKGGKTKRSKIRKSIKKKQSMKKSGFSRRSIKKKHRRSRKQR